MKRIILLIAFVLNIAISNAQVRFWGMPELSTGYCKLSDNIMGVSGYDQGAFQFSGDASLGVAIDNYTGTLFAGATVGRDGYAFSMSGVTCSVGSTTIGVQGLQKLDFGLICGGFIGGKIWDKSMRIDGEKYTLYGVGGEFVITGKFGYSWDHVALMFNIGKNGGFNTGISLAFPIYEL